MSSVFPCLSFSFPFTKAFSCSLHHHCSAHYNERSHVNPLCPCCRSLCVWFRRVTISFSPPPLIPSFVPPAAIASHGLSSSSIAVPPVNLLLFFFISLSLHALHWCPSVCLLTLCVVCNPLSAAVKSASLFLNREVSQGFRWPSDTSSFMWGSHSDVFHTTFDAVSRSCSQSSSYSNDF